MGHDPDVGCATRLVSYKEFNNMSITPMHCGCVLTLQVEPDADDLACHVTSQNSKP